MVEWRKIESLNDYEVSSDGRIRFIGGWRKTGRGQRFCPPAERKLTHDKDGYLGFQVSSSERKTMNFKVHRVVAQAFLSNPENLPRVNHKDGNKENNTVENLEWSSHKDDCYHRDNVLGKHCRGERQGRSKLTEEQVKEIKHSTDSQVSLANRFGVHKVTIHDIIHGINWKHII